MLFQLVQTYPELTVCAYKDTSIKIKLKESNNLAILSLSGRGKRYFLALYIYREIYMFIYAQT